ncbi:MAG: sugar ABC transporter permease [Phycisphaeraceae bacterium]|nr:MAG: sugar ABC transporter permease [Phycisphaeraceae bacterium]
MGREARSAWLFISVPLTVLMVFTLAPTVLGLGLSLFDWDGSGWPRFVGLANYRGLAGDASFGPALKNTLVFAALTVPASVLIGFLLACAVNAPWFRGRTTVRTMLFLPTVVSIVSIGFVWRWLLENQGGLVPEVMRRWGVEPPDFLSGGDAGGLGVISWPMLSIVMVQVWRSVGFCVVLYLASMQQINASLYEAAECDGAGRWTILRRITWPQVAPMTAFLFITSAIGALQVFDVVVAMTGSTNMSAQTDRTRVLNTMVLAEFRQSRLGYASAIGAVIFGLTALVTAAQLWATRRGRA